MRSEHQEGAGAHIARQRAERGWSQRELAKVVGLDQSAVSRIEAGRRRVSSAELQRFADVFHVSADTLLSAGGEAAGAGMSWNQTGSAAGPPPHLARALRRPSGEHELLAAIEREKVRAVTPGERAHALRIPEERPGAVSEARADIVYEPWGADEDAEYAFPAGAPHVLAREASSAPEPEDRAVPPGASSSLPRAAYGALASRPGPRETASPDRAPDEDLSPAPGPAASGGAVLRAARAGLTTGGPARPATEDWATDVAGVVRDWFVLRELTAPSGPELPWSTGQTAEGKPAFAPRPWQPVVPPPGSGDVLYDRVARFWRSELHVDPEDGPLPDLVPLLEEGLGIQVIVARVQCASRALPELAGVVSDPRPVAATVVSDGVPFVFVNAGRPVVLQRFALVHSFAHLALGHGDVVDESIGWSRANPPEAAANDFAEEFLAPVRAVERWYGRRGDLPRSPTLDTLLELANAFGISAWAALFRSRAAGRLNPRQFAALRARMRNEEWELLPRQAFLGGVKDTLAHLTPAEVLPVGESGPPAVLRVPACMRARALAALRDRRLSLEDAAAMLRLRSGALADRLEALGLA